MSVLRFRDFRLLWTAATVSQTGTQLTGIALPLLVIQTLHASTFAVGVLGACETAAFLLVGLPAGAWVDRMRRRPVLVSADLVRAALLASLPVAWWAGCLTLAQVYAVAVVGGVCTVFFDVAYQSVLPDLVPRDRLVDANARLSMSESAAAAGGPAVGGLLVQALTAPAAIVADAASYVVSAACIGGMRSRLPVAAAPGVTRLRTQVREGLSYVVRHPLLRPIATSTGTMNLGSAITSAVVVVFLVRTLHQSASAVGLLMSAGAVGGVLGAATAGRFARRVGQVRAIWLGPLATSPFLLLLPLAQEGPLLVLVVLAELVGVVGLVYFNVAQVSLRQAVTPPQLLGRMNATMRFLVWGPLPLGGVVGGALGDAIGVRPTLWVGVLVTQVGLLPLLTPALRRGEAPAFDPDEELLGLAERVQQQ